MIFRFLLIFCLAQSEWEEELGKEVENLDATEDGEAREEPHRAADQTKSTNEGHLWFNLVILLSIYLCNTVYSSDRRDKEGF